ncbi:MAG: peroxiredoxin family protein [Candidatus Hodarchaeales archaeon]|jgi:thiol-disulfide isomerase/thioredoxin
MIKKHKKLLGTITFTLFIFIFSFNFSTLPVLSSISSTGSVTIERFSFTLVEGEVTDLSEYTGKPLVIEWGASWCDICKENQKSIQSLYQVYKDEVNFLSLSYGGSGDSASDYGEIKTSRGYSWQFGVDHTNFASTVGVSTGTVWVLDDFLNLEKQWLYQLAPANSIAETLNAILGENAIVDTDFNNNAQYSLLNDPLILIFVVGVTVLTVSLIFVRFRSQKIIPISSEIKESTKKVDNQLNKIKDIVTEKNRANSSKKPISTSKNKNTSKRKKIRRR